MSQLPRHLSLLCLGTAMLSLNALADDRVVRDYTFDVSAIDEIELHGSVGSMHIVPVSGTEVRVVLEIKADHTGWFGHRVDVSEVELDSRVRGKRLVLTQDEDNTNTQWTVQIPAVEKTTIQFGVGEIKAALPATALDIDLGVGDIDVSVPAEAIGDIELTTGVGDANLHGAEKIRAKQKFVSQHLEGRGKGESAMTVHVGVGDIDVDLD